MQTIRRHSFKFKFLGILFLLSVLLILFLAFQIITFSSFSSSSSADTAVVLGAAVWNGRPSPVFEERIKHGIHLLESGQVQSLIFTGGIGDHDTLAESEVARLYAMEAGVPDEKIFIETTSHITYENLLNACQLMRDNHHQSALIVSDPLHMKRAMTIAEDMGLDAEPSPTPTSRYQTWRSKSGSLAYELFFYILHIGHNTLGLGETCPN